MSVAYFVRHGTLPCDHQVADDLGDEALEMALISSSKHQEPILAPAELVIPSSVADTAKVPDSISAIDNLASLAVAAGCAASKKKSRRKAKAVDEDHMSE